MAKADGVVLAKGFAQVPNKHRVPRHADRRRHATTRSSISDTQKGRDGELPGILRAIQVGAFDLLDDAQGEG